MSKPPQTFRIFLSYSRSDLSAANDLYKQLTDKGFSVFKDDASIAPGRAFVSDIERSIGLCEAFVLLFGRDGVRGWVEEEVWAAFVCHRSPAIGRAPVQILPVLLDDAVAEDLPLFLRSRNAVRWRAGTRLPETFVTALPTAARSEELTSTPVDGCPFFGLGSFRAKDAYLFFGRRAETVAALSRLGDQRAQGRNGYQRWLHIEGNSGVGKSSLVHAGILPMIERSALWSATGFQHWRILGPMVPGADPLERLAEALERTLKPDKRQRDSAACRDRLLADPGAFALRLRDARGEGEAFLLVVDQFEELFTLTEDSQRGVFDAVLAKALTDPACPFFLISTMRSDFHERMDWLPELREHINGIGSQYLLPPITMEGLREAIEQPARLAGLDVDEVVEAILTEARDEPNALPLVENALEQLWRERSNGRLSGRIYREQGGLGGMLSGTADGLLDNLERTIPDGRQGALELLLALTQFNPSGQHSRRRLARDDALFVAGNGNDKVGERVLLALSGRLQDGRPEQATPAGSMRLISTGLAGDVAFVELTHETLVRTRGFGEGRTPYWRTLHDYIERNPDRDLLHQQLKLRASRWVRAPKPFRWLFAVGPSPFRRLRVRRASQEGRFLAASRRANIVVLLVFAFPVLGLSEAAWWVWTRELPIESMLTLTQFRLGYQPIPELARVPSGSFDFGEHEPRFRKKFWSLPKRIQIPNPLDVGKHEVTFDQFDFYLWSEGRQEYPANHIGGRGKHPVVNVTFDDAMGYAHWLGRRLDRDCRLPTETEWEYAARAGSNTGYSWGDDPQVHGRDPYANCKGCGTREGGVRSVTVGSLPDNAFGLFETLGNVYEWTCSPWRNENDGARTLCVGSQSTPSVQSENQRVVRGGSWQDEPERARSSARFTFGHTNLTLNDLGFRVVCSTSEVAPHELPDKYHSPALTTP